MVIIRLTETTSTNAYAKRLLEEGVINSPTCILAYNQTEGKGMLENIWTTEANKNLTFSIVCFPDFLSANRQFVLNKLVALSVFDLLRKVLPNNNISIKWPNDILIENKKLAGILIENSVMGQKLNWVIIGIGINVNQTEFPTFLPNATSLIHFTGKKMNIDKMLNLYLRYFDERYSQLYDFKYKDIDDEYLKVLYRYGIVAKYVYKQKLITATITGINEFGWLKLITPEGINLECELKEIVFVD